LATMSLQMGRRQWYQKKETPFFGLENQCGGKEKKVGEEKRTKVGLGGVVLGASQAERSGERGPRWPKIPPSTTWSCESTTATRGRGERWKPVRNGGRHSPSAAEENLGTNGGGDGYCKPSAEDSLGFVVKKRDRRGNRNYTAPL